MARSRCPFLAFFWFSSIALIPPLTFAQTTALRLDSRPGDYVGGGLDRTWTGADLTFTAAVSPDRRHVQVSALGEEFSTFWYLDFAAQVGHELIPGVYENATMYPLQPSAGNGLDVRGDGRGCTGTGRFQIYELDVDAAGVVQAFAADFEQHCRNFSAGLFGAIRYRAARASLEPFDGNYPIYGLRITPAQNGYVVGPNLLCGAGGTACEARYEPDSLVAIQAVPSPGYVFLGWAGLDCVGTAGVTVKIMRMMACTPVFNAAPGETGVASPDYSANAFFVDGYFDIDYVESADGHVRVAYVSPGSVLSIVNATRGEVQIKASGPRGKEWLLKFAAAAGQSLAATTYSPTAAWEYIRSTDPVLSISGPAAGCSYGGRFRIHELEYAGDVLSRFSVDFEAPCPGGTIAGSARYRSARATLLPFDGAYPATTLKVLASTGGYVDAAGISCGDGGRTDCAEEYASTTLVELRALPSPGYDFLGWSGRCGGADPLTSILMDRSATCIAVFHPSVGSDVPAWSSFGVASLFLENQSGGATSRAVYLSPDASVLAERISEGHLRFTFTTMTTQVWVTFRVPSGILTPGDYEGVTGFDSDSAPSFRIFGCAPSSGRFTVYEAQYGPTGDLVAFAADVEMYCTGGVATSYLVGAVRLHSSLLTLRPFGGTYPRYRLAVTVAEHGNVRAPGILCGPAGSDCSETLSAPATLAIQAMPEPGYRFLGWTGDCDGGVNTSVSIDRARHCSAVFGPLEPGTLPQDSRLASNAVLVISHPGDPIGLGRRDLLLDGTIHASSSNRTDLYFSVSHHRRTFSMDFRVPAGQQLRVGTYEGATRIGLASAGIDIEGSDPYTACRWSDGITGRFTVYEIAFGSAASAMVTALAIDFEYRCTPTSPPLIGSIRYRSSRQELRPFPPGAASSVPFDLNADGAADLLWQNREDGRLWFWHMSGATHFFNEWLAPDQVADTNWHVVGSGDADHDGFTDLYWQHQTTGQLAIWYMRGHVLLSGEPLTPSSVADTSWKVRSVADLNRDGYPDLIWQHVRTGDVAVWFMNNRRQVSGRLIGPGPVADLNWTIVGVGDVNRDGWTDLLWHHIGTGQLSVWFMAGATMLSGELLSPGAVPDTDWRVRGVADLDRNGYPDLLWQHLSTRDVAVWFMHGRQLVDGRPVVGPPLLDPAWHLVSPK
jgi:hypothetical protein